MADNSSHSLLPAHGGQAKLRSRHSHTERTPLIVVIFGTLLIGSIVTSVTIVITSNNDPVQTWAVRPNVLLSVMSSIFSASLEILLGIGIAVSWWRALAQGTTLKRLHYAWHGSNPLFCIPAFLAGSDARKVAVAGLIIACTKFVEGPLLQRSTGVKTQDVSRDIDIKMAVAQTIPDGLLGDQNHINTHGLGIEQMWFLNGTITADERDGYFCPGNGTCSGRVPAAGINYGCGNETQEIDLLDSGSIDQTVFEITTNMRHDYEVPMLFLTMRYISAVSSSCRATVTTETCNIVPATVMFPVVIKEKIIEVDYRELLGPRVIVSNYTSAGDKQTADNTTGAGPLRSLFNGLGPIFQSHAILSGPRTYNSDLETPNNNLVWADIFYNPQYRDISPQTPLECSIAWVSPSSFILASISEVLFRAAYLFPGPNGTADANVEPQIFTATFNGTEIWYDSDLRTLGAAILIMLLGVFSVILLLWGWWDLDHHVTLSPLETGKAFGAPILLSAGPEKEALGIVARIGHERVAHDGEELIWNGTVYTNTNARWQQGGAVTGSTANTARRRQDGSSGIGSVEEWQLGELPGGDSLMGQQSNNSPYTYSHRRSGSLNRSGGSISGNRTGNEGFQHSMGASTRQWYDDSSEDVTVTGGTGGVQHQRQRSLHTRSRSGSGGSHHTPIVSPSPTRHLIPRPLVIGNEHGSVRGRRSSGGARPLSEIVEGGSIGSE